MMKLYTSNGRENFNCPYYPNEVVVNGLDDFKRAVARDYVACAYKDHKRSNDNFIESNALMLDCDNTHSDDKEAWVTVEDVETCFPNVEFYYHYSRNHMHAKVKNGKTAAARPKFHVVFPLKETVKSAANYVALKEKALACFAYENDDGDLESYFDSNARDAARFFAGTDEPKAGHVGGKLCIDELFNANSKAVEAERAKLACLKHGSGKHSGLVAANSGVAGDIGTPIKAGERNATLSAYALKVLKRHGDTDEALDKFMLRAKDCTDPLDSTELDEIYAAAQRKFNSDVKKRGDYVPAADYDMYGFKYLPKEFNEKEEAQVLACHFRDKLAYAAGIGWLAYDGTRWVSSPEKRNPKAFNVVMELADLQIAEAKDARNKLAREISLNAEVGDDTGASTKARYKLAKKYYDFAVSCGNDRKGNSVLAIAEGLLGREASEFDANPYLLNTPNGTVDLRTATIRKNDPKDLLTQITNIAPYTDAEFATLENQPAIKQWLDELNLVFCSHQDEIDCFQRIIGMACFGKIYQEKLFIAVGNGSNGKSTVFNAMFDVLGTYSGKLSARVLSGDTEHNRVEYATLRGKRLVVISETEQGAALSSEVVKSIVSKDPIVGEAKFKAPITFTPSHTTFLHTNFLPEIQGRDNGTRRRLSVIPFNARISDDSQSTGAIVDVKNFEQKLVEESGRAIMTWLMYGAALAYEEGFNFETPKGFATAIECYQEDYDWLNQFLLETVEVDSDFAKERAENPDAKAKAGGFSASSNELYRLYCLWAKENGESQRSSVLFKKEMEREGFTYKHTKVGNVVYGLTIRGDVCSRH